MSASQALLFTKHQETEEVKTFCEFVLMCKEIFGKTQQSSAFDDDDDEIEEPENPAMQTPVASKKTLHTYQPSILRTCIQHALIACGVMTFAQQVSGQMTYHEGAPSPNEDLCKDVAKCVQAFITEGTNATDSIISQFSLSVDSIDGEGNPGIVAKLADAITPENLKTLISNMQTQFSDWYKGGGTYYAESNPVENTDLSLLGTSINQKAGEYLDKSVQVLSDNALAIQQTVSSATKNPTLQAIIVVATGLVLIGGFFLLRHCLKKHRETATQEAANAYLTVQNQA
jgi:hypothetical protein